MRDVSSIFFLPRRRMMLYSRPTNILSPQFLCGCKRRAALFSDSISNARRPSPTFGYYIPRAQCLILTHGLAEFLNIRFGAKWLMITCDDVANGAMFRRNISDLHQFGQVLSLHNKCWPHV